LTRNGCIRLARGTREKVCYHVAWVWAVWAWSSSRLLRARVGRYSIYVHVVSTHRSDHPMYYTQVWPPYVLYKAYTHNAWPVGPKALCV
jgi:hypothetical protein